MLFAEYFLGKTTCSECCGEIFNRLFHIPPLLWSIEYGSRRVGAQYVVHRILTNIPEFVLNEYREIAQKYLENGSDIVVFAHTHVPELHVYKNGIYCNTGSWLGHNNFASMDNGQIKLWHFLPDFTLQEILSIVYK